LLVAVAVEVLPAPVKVTSVEPVAVPLVKMVQLPMTVFQLAADAVVARLVQLLFQQKVTAQFQVSLLVVLLLTTVAVAVEAGGVVPLELTKSPTQWVVEVVAQATLTQQRLQTQF
jgi:hypothetical protein